MGKRESNSIWLRYGPPGSRTIRPSVLGQAEVEVRTALLQIKSGPAWLAQKSNSSHIALQWSSCYAGQQQESMFIS
jgi:hypothetical protein